MTVVVVVVWVMWMAMVVVVQMQVPSFTAAVYTMVRVMMMGWLT